MKILIDENLSWRIKKYFVNTIDEIKHVSDVKLLNSPDQDIWNWAKNHKYDILTKDTDFYFLSSFYGCPPKIIRLNVGNLSTNLIVEKIFINFDTIESFLNQKDDCYLDIF
ncbi:DUF5615 family PIN-like protein [Aquiflexum lacus]|uniref:DUF5615 family PIN-like protein n=1 Tax=Aquiflexum lacus TaxID=2483805 RepID=UPI0018937E88